MRVFLYIALFTILFSCGKNQPDFEGVWIDVRSKVHKIFIEKSGENFIVKMDGLKFPAVREEGFLMMDRDMRIFFDVRSGELIFDGRNYMKMTGDLFVGKWASFDRGSLLDVVKDRKRYSILWKSRTDSYIEHEFPMEFSDGKLVLRKKKGKYGNVEITYNSPDQIKIVVDDHPEFTPLTALLSPTESTFPVKNGNDFVGAWGDDKSYFLQIEKVGKNRYFVDTHGYGSWYARYDNGSLDAYRRLPGGERPELILLSRDLIRLKGLYYEMSSAHDFKRNDALLAQSTSSDESDLADEEVTRSVSTAKVAEPVEQASFYVINVVAVKSKSKAESEVRKLEKEGYEAGYLWIPDYMSLSGAELYSVYIGPFFTQRECELAVENYRKKKPKAYATLVSHENKRVEIRGVGKVKVIEPYH